MAQGKLLSGGYEQWLNRAKQARLEPGRKGNTYRRPALLGRIRYQQH